jgi:hypothetical protein
VLPRGFAAGGDGDAQVVTGMFANEVLDVVPGGALREVLQVLVVVADDAVEVEQLLASPGTERLLDGVGVVARAQVDEQWDDCVRAAAASAGATERQRHLDLADSARRERLARAVPDETACLLADGGSERGHPSLSEPQLAAVLPAAGAAHDQLVAKDFHVGRVLALVGEERLVHVSRPPSGLSRCAAPRCGYAAAEA